MLRLSRLLLLRLTPRFYTLHGPTRPPSAPLDRTAPSLHSSWPNLTTIGASRSHRSVYTPFMAQLDHHRRLSIAPLRLYTLHGPTSWTTIGSSPIEPPRRESSHVVAFASLLTTHIPLFNVYEHVHEVPYNRGSEQSSRVTPPWSSYSRSPADVRRVMVRQRRRTTRPTRAAKRAGRSHVTRRCFGRNKCAAMRRAKFYHWHCRGPRHVGKSSDIAPPTPEPGDRVGSRRAEQQ